MAISGSFSANALTITQALTATGALKGIVYTGAVNTNQTLSTEIPSLTLTTAGREWATGALATQREVLITAPTYSFVGASTITDAATVGIAGAPIQSTNASITNTHGLLIQAGAVSTATNSYGLTVNAQTGATNNYAAQFIGGNVGIGTAAPIRQLDVYGTEDLDNQIGQFTVRDSASTMQLNIGVGVWGGGKTAMIQSTESGVSNDRVLALQGHGGSVGIGTIGPGARLEVKGSGTTSSTSALKITNSTPTTLFEVKDNGQLVGINTYLASGYTTPLLQLGTATESTQYQTIQLGASKWTSTGDTSIGAGVQYTHPTNAFLFGTSLSNSNMALYPILSGESVFKFQTSYDGVLSIPGGGGEGDFSLRMGGTNVLAVNHTRTTGYISNVTNFGIGTTGSGKALEINSATGANMRLTYNDADGSAANYADLSTSSSGDLTIAPSGGDTNITGAITTTSSIRSGTNSLFYGVSDVAYLELYNPALGNLSLGITVNDSTHGNILFKTNNGTNGERMRITNVGNLKIGGTALRGTTEGTNHLDIFDGTAPSGTLTNGVSLYSDTGELRVMDAAGNNTLLSPHEDENNYWVFDSTNSETGKSIIIDMEEMMKRLNNTFGWDFVHETIDGVATLPEDNVPLVLPDTFFEAITGRLVAWFADASNGITDMFAVTYYAKEEICINETCINEEELKALLENAGVDNPAPAPEPEPELVPEEEIIPTSEEVPTCTEPQTLVDNVCTDPEPEIIPEPDSLVPSEPVEGEPTPEEPVAEPVPEVI